MSKLSEEQFIALVKKAESDADNNLSSYKLKVALFALLGYGVIFGLLALLVSLVGGTLAIAIGSSALLLLLIKKKIIFAILAAIWVLVRALWVKFERPQGYELQRKDFPKLYAEIDRLTKELKALKVHRVILSRDLNAAVVQHSRLGVFGWNENVLIIGLQLLIALSEEEMRSVLAHEFGHLSGNHSRFSGFIYRARYAWDNIMHSFQSSSSWGARLLSRFFNWYVPRFSAYSFALARNNEFEADAIAASLTSPEIATKALINVYATAPWIEQEYWSSFYKQADEHEHPKNKPYDGLKQFMKLNILDRKQILDRIKSEMKNDTHYADTHPSLKDRVSALQSKPVLPERPVTNAAEAWLGNQLVKVMEDFDRDWMSENKDRWKNRYEYVQSSQEALKTLSEKPLETLTDEELWKLTSLTHEFVSEKDAKPLYVDFLERHPEDREAAYYLGAILFREKDEACMQYFAIAIKSARYLEEAGQMGYHLLNELKKPHSAEEWWDKVMEQHEIHKAADRERSYINEKDTYVTPDREEVLLNKFKNAVFTNKDIKEAWLACKQVEHYRDFPVYVIAITAKGMGKDQDKLEDSILNYISERIDAQIFVVSLKGEHKAIAKKVKQAGVQLV